jgi:hypothetical protein
MKRIHRLEYYTKNGYIKDVKKDGKRELKPSEQLQFSTLLPLRELKEEYWIDKKTKEVVIVYENIEDYNARVTFLDQFKGLNVTGYCYGYICGTMSPFGEEQKGMLSSINSEGYVMWQKINVIANDSNI